MLLGVPRQIDAAADILTSTVNIWCGSCNAHIGMGVRYNAEKKKIGNYYTTPIYSFRCK